VAGAPDGERQDGQPFRVDPAAAAFAAAVSSGVEPLHGGHDLVETTADGFAAFLTFPTLPIDVRLLREIRGTTLERLCGQMLELVRETTSFDAEQRLRGVGPGIGTPVRTVLVEH
jgi:hypothetical protein